MGKWQDRLDYFQRKTGLPANRDSLRVLMKRHPGFGDPAWEKLSFRRLTTIETILVAWQLYQMQQDGFQVGDRVECKPGVCGASKSVGIVANPWWNMSHGIPIDWQDGTGKWVWHPRNLNKLPATGEAA